MFILASNKLFNKGASASDFKIEDDQNTLRAWGFDDYSPTTPLFVEALSSEKVEVLERTCTAVVCLEELKQLFLASSCLYRGSATLMTNLLQKVRTYSSFQEPYHAQYGDGASNSLHEVPINELFVGMSFTHLSCFIFREFQACLIGVNRLALGENRQVLLNPGSEYLMKKDDLCFFVATSDSDIDDISRLTSLEHSRSLNAEFVCQSSIIQSIQSARSGQFPPGDSPLQSIREFSDIEGKIHSGEYIIDYPSLHDETLSVHHLPQCVLLTCPHQSIEVLLIDSATGKKFINHILVCTGSYNIFNFLCTLRSRNLTQREFRRVLILCIHLPTPEEFKLISIFPEVYIIIGDAQKRAHLEHAGIQQADKIVLMNMSNAAIRDHTQDNDPEDGFEDSTAIMVGHVIYGLDS